MELVTIPNVYDAPFEKSTIYVPSKTKDTTDDTLKLKKEGLGNMPI